MVFALKIFSDLSLNLIHFRIVIFASCICLVTLKIAHIWSTSLLTVITMIVVKAINMIMYAVSFFIRHGRRWSLAMMIFMMYIINLRHRHRLPSRSSYWSSSSLILVRMVASALPKVFSLHFPPSYWVLESNVLSFPIFPISKSSGLCTVHMAWRGLQW